jgi:transcriptional regulator with XRE-family HTH domain
MLYYLQFSIMENLDKEIESKILKIAEKIKLLRKAKGFTSYETFAFEYEINRVQYWRIETGRNITLKTLLKVLSIHKISLETFFKDL